MNKSTLVVEGYVHMCEELLTNDVINVIPMNVMAICHIFYFIPTYKLMYYQETANFIYSYDTTIPHGFISIEISNKQINIDNIISIDCGKSNNHFYPKDSNIFCRIPDNSVNGNGILADSYLLPYKIDADGAHFTKSYSQTHSHDQIKPN
eukprot:377155_1